MDDTKRKEHPGPQVKSNIRYLFRSTIHYLVAITAVLTFYAVIQANIEQIPFIEKDNPFWQWTLLDIETATTLLITMTGLLYARNQFEHGYMPLFDYRINFGDETSLNLQRTSNAGRILKCSLANQGGTALITSATYDITFGPVTFKNQSYHDLVKLFGEKQLVLNRDYSLVFISAGWALGAKEERVIFEIDSQAVPGISQLSAVDIKLQFTSLLGDAYEKNIYCIPRRGIHLPPVIAPAA